MSATEPRVVSLRNLLGDTAVYGLGHILDRLVGFLLLPLVTLLLTPADYGILSMFGTTSYVLFLVFSMGLHHGFFRFFTEASDNDRRRTILSTTFWGATGFSLLWSLPLLAFALPINRWIGGESGVAFTLALVFLSYLRVLDAIGTLRLQADGRAWTFFAVNLTHTVVGRGLGLGLMLLAAAAASDHQEGSWTVWGWLGGELIGMFVAMLLLAWNGLRDVRLQLDRPIARTLLPYSVSLVPAQLSFWLMTGCDVYLLRALADDPFTQAGIYTVGLRIASIMQLANIAFLASWKRFAFYNMHLEAGIGVLARSFTLFLVAGGYVAFGLALLGDDLTHWLLPSAFEEGMRVIAPLTLSAFCAGLAEMAEIGLHKTKRTFLISLLTFSAALVNLGLAYLLIPHFGIIGAAVSTLACHVFKAGFLLRSSQRVFPLPLDYRRMGVAALLLGAAYWIGQLAAPESSLVVAIAGQGSWIASTLLQSLVAATVPFVFWFVFLHTEEREALLEYYERLRARFGERATTTKEPAPTPSRSAEATVDEITVDIASPTPILAAVTVPTLVGNMTEPETNHRRILVTGAAGFIGFQVSRRLLDRGDRVAGLDNLNPYYDVQLKRDRLSRLTAEQNFEFFEADLADRNAVPRVFESFQPRQVIHLAAQAGVRYSVQNPHAYVDSNLVGFVNVLEACRRHQIEHLVYASSSSVYGGSTRTPFSVEQSVDHPLSLYAATKKANELMAHTYSHLFGLPTTGLRFFTVYGPWGRPDMATFLFTKAILEGRPIDVYNHGDMKRDFTYIDDIAEGIIRVADRIPTGDPNWSSEQPNPGTSRAPYRVYNIGNHEPVDLLRFIAVLEDCLGKKAQMNMLPMQPGDVPMTFADVQDLERDVGFRPSTPIETGIRRFVEWYREYYQIDATIDRPL